MVIDGNETFYFIAFTNKVKTKVTIIDLSHAVSYTRDDWAVVDDKNFQTLDKAIKHVRSLVEEFQLDYEPFDSRYERGLSEPRHEVIKHDKSGVYYQRFDKIDLIGSDGLMLQVRPYRKLHPSRKDSDIIFLRAFSDFGGFSYVGDMCETEPEEPYDTMSEDVDSIARIRESDGVEFDILMIESKFKLDGTWVDMVLVENKETGVVSSVFSHDIFRYLK